MTETTTPSAPALTLGDIDQAVSTLNAIAKDGAMSVCFRRVVEQSFNPDLIQLIRGMHADSDRFCDLIRPFFADVD